MLRDRLLKTVLSEILRDLDGKIDAPAEPADTIQQNTPTPRGALHMISTGNNAPLFFSPNEEKIIELLKAGPQKQAAVILALELEMNATTCKELLANLIKRKIIFNGPDGYEVIA